MEKIKTFWCCKYWPIIDYFNEARNEEYREFLDKCDDFHKEIRKEIERNYFSFVEIEENEHELSKLNLWLEGIIRRDFFTASLMEQSQTALLERFIGASSEVLQSEV